MFLDRPILPVDGGELRDTLQGDSWKSLKLDSAFFYLRDFSGHLIGHDHRMC